MKAITIFITMCCCAILAYSQDPIKNASIAFTSDQISFSYSPTVLFSNISIATNKFVSGRSGIEFFFISKPRQKTAEVRVDSIILKLSTDTILTLKNLFADTIYYRNDGGLSLTAIHWLDKDEVNVLKHDRVTAIILIVDTNRLLINLSRKSQLNLLELLNSTL